MFIHPTGSYSIYSPPVTPAAAPLSKSEGFTQFQCRLGCLITYFASMVLANKMDLSTFLPKEGAPFFAGHKDEKANLFIPTPGKRPEELSQDFLKAIESRLGPHLRGRKKLIRQIHKWGSHLVSKFSTKALDDIEGLLNQIIDSPNPQESNAKLLRMIKDLVTPVFDICGRSAEEKSPTIKEGTTPLSYEERAVLQEKIIFEIMGYGFDPHANLPEVAKRYLIDLDLANSATKSFVRKELLQIIGIGKDIPSNWDELKGVILQAGLVETEALEIIYKLQKLVFIKSIENYDPYTVTDSLDPEILAFRRLTNSQAKQEYIWSKQVELSLSKMTPEQRAGYDAKLEETIARTQSNQERLKLLAVRDAMPSELEKGIQEITLKHLEPYGCDSIAEYEKTLRVQLKRKHPRPEESAKVQTIFSATMEEFNKKLEPEINLLINRLYTRSEKKIYQDLTISLASKFAHMGDVCVNPTLKKTKKKYANWSQKASSNPLEHLGYCVIGAVLAFFTFICSGSLGLFQRSWNSIKNKVASQIMTPITEGVFGGILNMLMQTETIRGTIFGLANYFAEHPSDLASGAPTTLDSAPVEPPSPEEIKEAGELFDTIISLSEKALPDDLKIRFGYNIFDIAKKFRETAAIIIAQGLRGLTSNKTETRNMLENALRNLPAIFDNWNAIAFDNEALRARARKEEHIYNTQSKPKLIQYALNLAAKQSSELARSYIPARVQTIYDTAVSKLSAWLPPFWAKRDDKETVGIGLNLPNRGVSLALDYLQTDKILDRIMGVFLDGRTHRALLFRGTNQYIEYLQNTTRKPVA
jgi:hypothetical protein